MSMVPPNSHYRTLSVVHTKYIMSMAAYTQRNETLLEMGFKDYKQYLRSPLWKRIRAAKMKKDPECFSCGKVKRLQVHHSVYDRRVLEGTTDEGLYTVCSRCHRWAEFTRAGQKRGPEDATKELIRIRKMRLGLPIRKMDKRVGVVWRKIRTIGR